MKTICFSELILWVLTMLPVTVLGQNPTPSREGEHKCGIHPCPHMAEWSQPKTMDESKTQAGNYLNELEQRRQAESAAAKRQEQIRQSQAASDAFKNSFNQLWEQQQNASKQVDWDRGAKEREDRLNATSKKVDSSLDQLSRAQNVLTWKQKIKEKEDLIAKTKATIARLEEAKKTIQSSQRDVENANRAGTYYAWAAQAVGVVEILDGMGVMVSAVLPPQYSALREALKKGRAIGKGIGAAGGTPIAMANSLQQGDNSGAVVDALKGVTAAVGAATTSKYASQQEKDFAENLGRFTDSAEILDASNKEKTVLAEYKKVKLAVNEMGPVGKRISEGLDGAEQIYSGSVKVSDMSDEEVQILTRAVAQKANFVEIMARVDARLNLERNTLIALETELYKLKEGGPNNPALSAY